MKIEYEATSTPPQPNGQAIYVYDGDGCGLCTPELRSGERGNMVKSVIGSVTTYYPRREYELRVEGTSETVVKYYFTTAGRTHDEEHRQGRCSLAGERRADLADGGPEQPSPSVPLPSLVEGSQTSVTSDINGAPGDTVKYSALAVFAPPSVLCEWGWRGACGRDGDGLPVHQPEE